MVGIPTDATAFVGTVALGTAALFKFKLPTPEKTISASLLPVFGTIGTVLTLVDANVFANGGTYGTEIGAVPKNGLFAVVFSSGNTRIGIRCKYPYPIPQPKLPEENKNKKNEKTHLAQIGHRG